MKAVLVFNRKKKTLDSFVYLEPGPLPPFVTPEDRDEPRDYKPAVPGARKPHKKERPS